MVVWCFIFLLIEWCFNSWNVLFCVVVSGLLGFVEGYINDEWESDSFLVLMIKLVGVLDQISLVQVKVGLSCLFVCFCYFCNVNFWCGSCCNIFFYYDFGNVFYSEWLDLSMIYFFVLFEEFDEDLQ